MKTAVAVRRYALDQSRCADTLYWINPELYRLHSTSDHPEEKPSEWRTFDAWQASEWLTDCPEQIFPPNVAAPKVTVV